MKNMSRTLGVLLLVAAVLVGCGIRRLPSAEEIAQRLPEYRAKTETLRRGRAMAVNSCSACHRFFFPDEYGPGAWPKIANDMGRRAFMGPRSTATVREYLTAASKHALKADADEDG